MNKTSLATKSLPLYTNVVIYLVSPVRVVLMRLVRMLVTAYRSKSDCDRPDEHVGSNVV